MPVFVKRTVDRVIKFRRKKVTFEQILIMLLELLNNEDNLYPTSGNTSTPWSWCEWEGAGGEIEIGPGGKESRPESKGHLGRKMLVEITHLAMGCNSREELIELLKDKGMKEVSFRERSGTSES